jgi:hypothetical protein
MLPSELSQSELWSNGPDFLVRNDLNGLRMVKKFMAVRRIFSSGGSKAYMPIKVPNIQRIINNDILKIVNIVFSGGAVAPLTPPPPPRCVRP